MAKNSLSRRNILKLGGISALAIGASRVMGNAMNEICAETPRQPEGPFYPINDQDDTNTDLTRVDGRRDQAKGKIIYLSGIVTDQNCQPVENAVVEIWQACESGRYNHPGDRQNPSPLDPDFQYWGITTSKTDGSYNFKTILPGHYNAGENWIRPPHIHFKIHKRGFKELITQMYFAGNQYNNGDRILQNIPSNERASVVREMRTRAPENGREAFDMSFDISIDKV